MMKEVKQHAHSSLSRLGISLDASNSPRGLQGAVRLMCVNNFSLVCADCISASGDSRSVTTITREEEEVGACSTVDSGWKGEE